jgi:hypothetical protein
MNVQGRTNGDERRGDEVGHLRRVRAEERALVLLTGGNFL